MRAPLAQHAHWERDKNRCIRTGVWAERGGGVGQGEPKRREGRPCAAERRVCVWHRDRRNCARFAARAEAPPRTRHLFVMHSRGTGFEREVCGAGGATERQLSAVGWARNLRACQHHDARFRLSTLERLCQPPALLRPRATTLRRVPAPAARRSARWYNGSLGVPSRRFRSTWPEACIPFLGLYIVFDRDLIRSRVFAVGVIDCQRHRPVIGSARRRNRLDDTPLLLLGL